MADNLTVEEHTMAIFTGKLGQNKILFSEVTGALYNMILNQEVESRTIGAGMASLIEEATRDVGLYGDRIIKYFTDTLRVYDYEPDGSDQLNVLKTYRPKAPICEQMVVDTAKFIPLTLDNYLTKQGFADEATFGEFNGVMQNWMRNTKKVYLAKEYNAFIGTTVAEGAAQNIEVALSDATDPEAKARIDAQSIAKAVADVFVKMTEDASRDYNDLEVEACYDKDQLIMVWNAEALNKITLMDVPTLYKDNEVLGALKQNIRRLPAKYFGDIVTSGTTDGKTHRALHQVEVGGKLYKAGDLYAAGLTIGEAVPCYQENATILCKIIHKDACPVLSGFETTTEFWNPSNLSRNDYLHFLFNSFDRFSGYPFVTVRSK